MGLAQATAETAAELYRTLGAFLPRLLSAVGLALAGWLVAHLARLLVEKLLQGWSRRLAGTLGRLFGRGGGAEAVRLQVELDRPVAEAVGRLVFWLALLFFLAVATETLGLPVISAWLSGVAAYLPRLVAAVLIVFLGFLAGGLARTALAAASASAGFAYAGTLGRTVQAIIAAASAMVAFEELGVPITFLTVVTAVVGGALVGGAALAFGLGACTAVSNIISCHYLLKVYRVGHHVRIGSHQGRILEITPTTVVLATPEGQVAVPAKLFSERASVLLTG